MYSLLFFVKKNNVFTGVMVLTLVMTSLLPRLYDVSMKRFLSILDFMSICLNFPCSVELSTKKKKNKLRAWPPDKSKHLKTFISHSNHMFRDQARGRLGRNNRPGGRNFALNGTQGEVGVSLKQK